MRSTLLPVVLPILQLPSPSKMRKAPMGLMSRPRQCDNYRHLIVFSLWPHQLGGQDTCQNIGQQIDCFQYDPLLGSEMC